MEYVDQLHGYNELFLFEQAPVCLLMYSLCALVEMLGVLVWTEVVWIYLKYVAAQFACVALIE